MLCQSKVQIDPIPAPTCTLTANAREVAPGTPVTLHITTTGKVSFLEVDRVSRALDTTSVTVTPQRNRLYLARVKGPGGETNCSLNVKVVRKPATCTLELTPSTDVKAGTEMKAKINITGDATRYLIDGVRGETLSRQTYSFTAGETSRDIVAKVWSQSGISICKQRLNIIP